MVATQSLVAIIKNGKTRNNVLILVKMATKKQFVNKLKQSINSTRNYYVNWTDSKAGHGKFIVKNNKTKKEAIGKVHLAKNEIKISLDYTNYSNNYIKKIIKDDILNLNLEKERINVTMNIPQGGSIITTKEFLDAGLLPGDKVDLRMGTYYYSVNSNFLDCNGWLLDRDFSAEFIVQYQNRCGGNLLPPMQYTKFKLI